MIAPVERHVLCRACLVAGAVALGRSLQIANGFYNERALVWLTCAFVLAAAGLVAWRFRPHGLHAFEGWLCWGTAAGIAWQVVSLLEASPGIYVEPDASMPLFRTGVQAAAVLVALGVTRVRAAARIWFPLLLVVHTALGVWMLRASPNPHIDVVVVHHDAFDALARLESPYAISFENIYGANSGFYDPRLADEKQVMFGYPYPPLNLLLTAPGHLLAGDYRYALLGAWVGAAGLIGYMGPGVFPKLVASLVVTEPRGLFVLEQGWTEPVALLVLALAVYAMVRRLRYAAWAGGLLLVTKQYLMLGVPLLWRFAQSRPRPGRFLSAAIVAAGVVTLPFFLWDPASFINSVVLVQLREPFRLDSLSYLSWAARHGWGVGGFVWAIAAALVTVVFGILVTPNNAGSFAVCLAVASFASFAFGSKAFCNYYFFVVGALCISAVACTLEAGQSDTKAVAVPSSE